MNAPVQRFLAALGMVALVTVMALSASVSAVSAQTAKAATPDSKAAPAAPAPAINWLSYDDGVAKTKGSDKHMLVDITASWCGWCT